MKGGENTLLNARGNKASYPCVFAWRGSLRKVGACSERKAVRASECEASHARASRFLLGHWTFCLVDYPTTS